MRRATRDQGGEIGAHGGGIGHVQNHAADFGFVQDIGREDFHHHGEAEAFGRADRGFGIGAGRLGHCGHAGFGQDALGFGLARAFGRQRHLQQGRRGRGFGGKGLAVEFHRMQGRHRARWVLEDQEAVGLVFLYHLRRRDHAHAPQPVWVFAHHPRHLGADMRAHGLAAAGLGEEA